jgi:hypothetical protein
MIRQRKCPLCQVEASGHGYQVGELLRIHIKLAHPAEYAEMQGIEAQIMALRAKLRTRFKGVTPAV